MEAEAEAEAVEAVLKLTASTSLVATRPGTRPIPDADGWAGAEMCVFALSQLYHPYGPTN